MEQDEETNRNTKGQEGKYEDMDLKRDEANEAWKDGSPKSEGEEFDEGMNLDYPEGEYDTANPVYEEGEYDTAGRGYSPAYRYSSSSHQDRENDEGGKSVDFSTEETSEFGRAPGEGAEMWGPPKESSTYQKYEMTQEEEKAAENDYSSGAGEEGVWSYDNEQDQQDEG